MVNWSPSKGWDGADKHFLSTGYHGILWRANEGVITMKEIIIDTEDIKNFFFEKLVKHGYAPTEDECEDLADVCFDYLYHLGLLEDIEEY
jgi:hypothetical protein